MANQEELKNLKVVEQKQKIEKGFTKWVDADADRKEKYGNVLSDIEAGYKTMGEAFKPFIYVNLALMAPSIINYAQEFGQYLEQLKGAKENPEAPKETAEALKEGIDEHFKDINEPTDQKIMAGLYKMYDKDIPEEEQAEFFKEIKSKYKGDFDKFAADVFENSIFSSPEKVKHFWIIQKQRNLEKDPAFVLSNQIMESMMGAMGEYRSSQSGIDEADRIVYGRIA